MIGAIHHTYLTSSITIATNFQRNPFEYAGLGSLLRTFLYIFVPFSNHQSLAFV